MKTYHPFLILLTVLSACSTTYKPPVSVLNVESGWVERIENFESEFVASRNIDIWFPEHYDGKKKFSVIYMHDGQMLYDKSTTWNKQEWGIDEVLGKLMRDRKIKNCIVVGVYNSGEGRHADYFPLKPWNDMAEENKQVTINTMKKTFGDDLQIPEFKSDDYLLFLTKELKPFIDSNYATLKDAENTIVAGSSKGGLISMYAICEYPEVFGGAACISTHWPETMDFKDSPIPESYFEYLKNNLPDPLNHNIYFSFRTETLDALYEPYLFQVDEIMRTHGFTHEKNWITQKFEGDNHSEDAWMRQIKYPFSFLLKK